MPTMGTKGEYYLKIIGPQTLICPYAKLIAMVSLLLRPASGLGASFATNSLRAQKAATLATPSAFHCFYEFRSRS
jgi:hypothetical protein